MNDCIEWTGCRTSKGYGSRRVNGRMTLTHRLAWEEEHGPIPAGLFVLHRCDNPPCLNPDHLFLGSNRDNALDMVAKGRNVPLFGARNPKARLTQSQVDDMRQRYSDGGVTKAELARLLGIDYSHARNILAGRAWPAEQVSP